MKRIRRSVAISSLALASGLGLAGPAASAGPGTTLHDVSAKAKETFDAAKADLVVRGKKARAAAESGDYAAWKAANESYAQKLAEMVSICEANVNDVTTLPTDLAQSGTKQVVAVLTSYFDVAPSMLKARLQFKAYANLAEHMAPADRLVIMKALASNYSSD